MTWSYPDLNKPFVVGKSGRLFNFVACDARVGHGLDMFDVPCVVTTNVLFILLHATLPTILVGFGVWSTVEGLELDILVGVLHTSIPRSARLTRL